MHKKKISKEQNFSLKDFPTIKIKNKLELVDHDPKLQLRNRAFIAKALIECLQDGDAEAFKEILGAHLDVVNKAQFAAETNIPERTLYRMVSKTGNPTLENIARVVHALSA